MKKLLFTILFTWVAASLGAAPITREQARKNALDFLASTTGSLQLSPVQNRAKLAPRRNVKGAKHDAELYYVFNRGVNEGYVIVSGDDQTLAVLGYTDEGEFDYNNLPDNMRSWLDSREEQLLELSQSGISEPRRVLATHDRIEPMVTTKWNQGDPYNQECPNYFTLGRSVTGCVATAMAQVLYYQRAKSVTETQADMPGYTGWTAHETYGNLKVEGIPAGSPIDWDNMTNTYGGSSTAKQKKAVAQLMHYCGVAVKMDYTNSSSGAQSSEVAGAFQKYFGYGSQTRFVYQSSYSDEAWDVLLYNELAQGRPFYLSGYNADGGHAFVCDGYDGNYCYHINWGWGGSSDGYFLLSKLNPASQGIGGSSGGYSDGEAAVIGCEPENYGTKAMPISNTKIKSLCVANFDLDGDGTFTYGEAAQVTDLGDVFKGQTTITAFEELYYFTSLDTLSADAFNGCTKLATVKLPKSLKAIGARAFAGCRALKTSALPEGLTSIGDSAFAGCRVLPSPALPGGLKHIGDNAFEGCAAMTALELPSNVQSIGSEAFKNCTKLTSMTLKNIAPYKTVLGANVFEGMELSAATLKVQQGTGAAMRQAPQWKDFGTIYEERNLSKCNFATLETNKKFYLYNVATGYYLTKGEAWGTQAIVADTDEPMRYELRHETAMPDGVYYLYSEDTGKTSRILFRTSNDASVGAGVRACFVDGDNSKLSNKSAYWKVQLVEGTENVYTLQVPSGVSDYNARQYLGVVPSHDSNAASPTYGAYSDIVYDDYAENCQWLLVAYDEAEQAVYREALVLKNLLAIGKSKRADTADEQAVYDNLESSIGDIQKACRMLRRKLNFVNFQEEAFRTVAIAKFDIDGNGEISTSEAAAVTSLDQEFYGNSQITDLTDLKRHFTGLTTLYGNAFYNCTALRTVVLPASVTDIYYRVFMNDRNLESVEMGNRIKRLGDNAFYNCKALKEVRIGVSDPSTINTGSRLFSGVPLADATLYVPYGSKELYAQADQWKDFGTIREMRAVEADRYMPLTTDQNAYVYNLGTRLSVGSGEAYGTQAIVKDAGLTFQLRRTNSMPENTYYLYNVAADKVLFRTSSDSKVGTGIKTCFVDGSLSSKAYWTVAPVEGQENVYTLQVPANDAEYTQGQYLGIDLSHASDAVSAYDNTYGLYYDISDSQSANIQWAFISVEQRKANEAFYALTEQLRSLLLTAEAQAIEKAAEQAVYDNFASTETEISAAIGSLRSKLHYIDFADTRAHTYSVNKWDDNEDGELSLEEAATVTDLGTTFRSTGIKSLDELRHFTALTALPDEAFRGCSSLVSLYVPAGVKTLGQGVFTSCSNLRYMALLCTEGMVDASTASLPSGVTAFVPQALMQTYADDAAWSKAKASVLEYTGTPTVTGQPASRQYGRANPKFTYVVSGAPINGEPVLTTEAETTTPVGQYDIVVDPGTITTPGLVVVAGTLTVERAPLTLTARSFTRNVGEANPEFTFTNSSLRNREKIDDVLLVQPTIECDATPDSPGGQYEIRIFGAEAENYEIAYVNGKLTVVDPVGVRGVEAEDRQQPAYDLSGRRVAKPKHGIYIRGRKKLAK